MAALFDLQKEEREQLLTYTSSLVQDYYENTKARNVSPDLNLDQVRNYISDFASSEEAEHSKIIDHVFHGLEKHAVQIAHPSYFGLFNPRTSFPSILADLMTATTNPQMAAWSHNPFTYAVEEYIIDELGKRFGYTQTDGTFCSGGAEANQTAVLCALNFHFPEYLMSGLRGLDGQPVIYCSEQTHHSIAKAARMCGLGINSIRHVVVNDKLEIDVKDLEQKIIDDTANGFKPFLVVATAGTTGPGSIDAIQDIAAIAKQHNLWFHVDSAFAGALALHSTYKRLLDGIELSDSITVDIHKWMAAPMGTGTFLTSHTDILSSTFRITAEYMPTEGADANAEDPYTHSIQWSRRSLGLRMYVPLLFFGWKGFEDTIGHHIEMGKLLKQLLIADDWHIRNDTELPIICFKQESLTDKDIKAISEYVLDSKKAWISVYPIKDELCLRACITNFATTSLEIKELVELLNQARSSL